MAVVNLIYEDTFRGLITIQNQPLFYPYRFLFFFRKPLSLENFNDEKLQHSHLNFRIRK